MTYLQAIVIALVQGVTELFPVSSLGHSVLVPAWDRGQLADTRHAVLAAQQRKLVLPGLHRCAALRDGACAAVVLSRRLDADRARVPAQPRAVAARPAAGRRRADERLAWLIVLATIPVGVTGLAFEHVFRTVFAKPEAAAILLGTRP